METERIMQMEQHLDRAAAAVRELSAALDQYEEAEESLRELSLYYGSSEWRQDLAADEAGLLPKNLKRGVLSEDALWNLLEDWRELQERLSTPIHRHPVHRHL